MRLSEINNSEGKEYLPRVSVNMDNIDPDDRSEIAGMLRGLMRY